MKQPNLVTSQVRRWATLKEAAEYVCCNPKTISRRFADGTLSRYRFGRRIRVDLDELDAVMASSEVRIARVRSRR